METSSLKRIVNKYTETSLIIRILIGMAIGVVLALAVPQFTGIKILGDLFVGALKAIAPLLVCLLIMSSLAQTKEGHNGNMKTVVILYMFSTVMGAIVAVAGSFLFPLKITYSIKTINNRNVISCFSRYINVLLVFVSFVKISQLHVSKYNLEICNCEILNVHNYLARSQ